MPTQQKFDVYDQHCPSRALLADVTGRWGALALTALRNGPLRFGQLHIRVDGISERMLSRTLKALEADGLIIRTTIPGGTEYALTDAGSDIAQRISALINTLYSTLRAQQFPASATDAAEN